jgi:hypothetical protein
MLYCSRERMSMHTSLNSEGKGYEDSAILARDMPLRRRKEIHVPPLVDFQNIALSKLPVQELTLP